MTETTTTVPLAPWEAPNFFSLKPGNLGNYGYISQEGAPVECTLEELQDYCRSAETLPLVWTPAAGQFTTAFDVPALLSILHERARENALARLKSQGRKAFFLLFLIPFIPRSSLLFAILAGLMFVIFPMVETLLQWLSLKRNGPESLARHSRSMRYEMWVYGRKAPVAAEGSGLGRFFNRDIWGFRLLTGILALLYFGQEWLGFDRSLMAASLIKEAVRDHGEWWRLGTAPLMHGSIMHILMNGMALVNIGRVLEQLAGKASMWIVFVFAALTGGLFSQIYRPEGTSVGASGGIMGLIGFLFVLALLRRQSLPPGFVNRIAVSIALTAFLGVIVPFIDNAAHLGGLLAGAALGFLLTPTEGSPVLPLPRRAWVDQLGFVSALVVIAFALLTAWKFWQFQ